MAKSDDHLTPSETDGTSGVSAGLVVGLVLGAALAMFVVQNTDRTTVTWLVFDAQQPLWVVLLATSTVTLVVVQLLGGARRRRKRKRID